MKLTQPNLKPIQPALENIPLNTNHPESYEATNLSGKQTSEPTLTRKRKDHSLKTWADSNSYKKLYLTFIIKMAYVEEETNHGDGTPKPIKPEFQKEEACRLQKISTNTRPPAKAKEQSRLIRKVKDSILTEIQQLKNRVMSSNLQQWLCFP